MATRTATLTQASSMYTQATITRTITSYTSTSYTSTSTIPALTTVALVPVTISQTLQSAEYVTSIRTTILTSYAETQTSRSTVLIQTTIVLVPTTTTQQLTTTTATSSSPHVVINEFEQNPAGEDRDNEWVELYNPTLSTVGIGGWVINTTQGKNNSYTISAGTQSLPGAFWTITLPGLFIDNDGDMLILLNSQRVRIDETPLLSDPSSPGDTRTWQRTPDAGTE